MGPGRFLGAILVGGVAAAAVLYAQHSYTPAEVAEGGRLFRANCAGCHGENGNSIPGAQLGTGKFRRANTDDDAIRLVRSGITDLGMPQFSGSLTEAQTGQVVAWLRSLGAPASGPASPAIPDAEPQLGDASRGKAVFEGKGNCLTCHRVNGTGARWAPDLSVVGAGPRGGGRGAQAAGAARGAPATPPATAAARGTAPAPIPPLPAGPSVQQLLQLQRALLDPNAEVSDANRTFRAVPRSGTAITGRLLNIDTFTVQLLDNNDRLVSLEKDNLRELTVIPSPMPSYRDRLSGQELSDLLSYLVSLR